MEYSHSGLFLVENQQIAVLNEIPVEDLIEQIKNKSPHAIPQGEMAEG